MYSHQARSRRHSGSNGEDDEPLSSSRVEEGRPEAYPRSSKPSSYRTESRKSSSTSGRASFESAKEPSSSRSYRDPDEWGHSGLPHSSHERYSHSSFKDGYLSSGRDNYDVVDPRNHESWSNRPNNVHYTTPSTGREWTQSYDHGRPSSSHGDVNWNASASYGNRTPTYEHWPVEEAKPRSSDERGRHRTGGEDRHSDRGSVSWRTEDRREENAQTWNRDWEPRQPPGKGWEPHRPSDNHRQEHPPRSTDDRSWEPAASWQSSRGETQSGQRSQHSKNNHVQKNNKGGKKLQQNHKHKRDWRNDDGNLNNWQRREPHQSTNRASITTTRPKPGQSPRKSRSRSPAESYHSRYSSPGRSSARSSSPVHRWRDPSPVPALNRTPSDRGRRKSWTGRHQNAASKSQSPRRSEKATHRHRSVSSSSSSRSRSTSRSPAERPKAVHRLPPATAVNDIPLLPINLGRPNMRLSRDAPHYRNGKNQANGRHGHGRWTSGRGSYESSMMYAPTISASASDMPPPPVPVAVFDAPAYRTAEPLPTTVLDSGLDLTKPKAKRGRHTGRHKTAGFKPIGQISSMKKFFPTDDDEIESVNAPVSGQAARIVEQHPPERERPGEFPSPSAPPQETSRIQSPPLREANISFRDDFQSARETTNGSWKPELTPSNWPTQLPDQESSEITRPTSPSGESPGELYTILSQVGEGTFGKVYKAQNTVTRVHVALKRIRMEIERDGFPVTAMREIKLLQSLRHGNVVRLYEMMVSNGSVYMVFEYMDHDLTGVLSQTQFDFTPAHLKSLCQQMLAGLAYLHHKGVIHRDIKGSNILINNRGELKLADFGLARFYQKRRRSDYTNRVITLWYRPPELLFGATVYGPEVDMWSAGCIMLELFTKKPVFQGNDEIHQLDVIYKIIGTPSPDRWSGLANLPWYELVKPKEVVHNHFRELFQKWLSPAALDLAERLLAYDPAERITAAQAQEAPYFTEEDPPPSLPVGLSTLEGEWHELETKRERAKKRRKIESAVP